MVTAVVVNGHIVKNKTVKISKEEVTIWGKNCNGTISSTTKFTRGVEGRLVLRGQQLTT
jgi:hypothetical protein